MDDAATVEAERASGVALDYSEVHLFHEKRAQLAAEHQRYVAAHPELAQLLHDFVQAALVVKPVDVPAFAAQHFAAYRPPTGVEAAAAAAATATSAPAAAAAVGGAGSGIAVGAGKR